MGEGESLVRLDEDCGGGAVCPEIGGGWGGGWWGVDCDREGVVREVGVGKDVLVRAGLGEDVVRGDVWGCEEKFGGVVSYPDALR